MQSLAQGLALTGGAPVRTRAWESWPRFDAGTEQNLLEVLRSSRWAISGPFIGTTCWERRFAEAFARYHDVPHCTPTTSGTSSLLLGLLALGIGPGDEVLVPGLTWVACASVVLGVGAVPVLVDVDRDTTAMSLSSAANAITSRTKAILLVHPFCTLADIDGFVTLARDRGVALIEDCSQAHGAKWKGRRVGTFGDVGCFSMQQSKVLTAGEGGALITRSAALHRKAEQLRADGRLFSPAPKVGQLELLEVGEVQGRNLCLSEFQAAILVDRLPHLDTENAVRARNATHLAALLRAIPGVSLLRQPEGAECTYYNFVIGIAGRDFADNSVDVVARALGAELGLPVFPIYRPMNQHPLYAPLRAPRGELSDASWARRDPTRALLPVAEHCRLTYLSLPHRALLGPEADMRDIAVAVEKVQRHAEQLRSLPQEGTRDAF